MTGTETTAFERRVYYSEFLREGGIQGLMGRFSDWFGGRRGKGESVAQSPDCGLLQKEWVRQRWHL